MSGKGKITPDVFTQVTEFCKTHTNVEAAKQFGLSIVTICKIKRHNSFKEMKQGIRKNTTPQPAETPFDKSDEPKPIIPPSKAMPLGENGEVKTRPAPKETCEPTKYMQRTAKEWYDLYEALRLKNGDLGDELEEHQKIIEDLKSQRNHLANQIEGLKIEKAKIADQGLSYHRENTKLKNRVAELEKERADLIGRLVDKTQTVKKTPDDRYVSVTIGDTTVSITRHE